MIKIYKQVVEERLKIMLEFLNSAGPFELAETNEKDPKTKSS